MSYLVTSPIPGLPSFPATSICDWNLWLYPELMFPSYSGYGTGGLYLPVCKVWIGVGENSAPPSWTIPPPLTSIFNSRVSSLLLSWILSSCLLESPKPLPLKKTSICFFTISKPLELRASNCFQILVLLLQFVEVRRIFSQTFFHLHDILVYFEDLFLSETLVSLRRFLFVENGLLFEEMFETSSLFFQLVVVIL